MEVKLSNKAAQLLKQEQNKSIKNTVLMKRCIQEVRLLSFTSENRIVLPPEIVAEIYECNKSYESAKKKFRIKYISKDDKEAQVAYDFAKYISSIYKINISAFVEYCLIRGLSND